MSSIAEACVVAVGLLLNTHPIEATGIQEFPDLEPPRVRLHVSYERKAEKDSVARLLDSDGTDNARTAVTAGPYLCTFDSPTSPHQLQKLCPPEGCWLADELRVEEIGVLLERQGY